MSISLKIQDTTTLNPEFKESEPVLVLDLLTERITVRELIRSRVYQEVKDYNTRQTEYFRGLVQPTNTEQSLNGYQLKKHANWIGKISLLRRSPLLSAMDF